jgi:hypothetical protein
MSNQEQEPNAIRARIPSYDVLRELLGLPKVTLWGVAGTVLFIAALGGVVLALLVK